MDSFVWIVGPVVVAFFGFLFWFIVGRMLSNRSEKEDLSQTDDRPAKYPYE